MKIGTETVQGRGLFICDYYIYEGYWKNDKFNGKGLYIFDSGNYCLGDFTDGTRHGEIIER